MGMMLLIGMQTTNRRGNGNSPTQKINQSQLLFPNTPLRLRAFHFFQGTIINRRRYLVL
jgi:hypothetical protein